MRKNQNELLDYILTLLRDNTKTNLERTTIIAELGVILKIKDDARLAMYDFLIEKKYVIINNHFEYEITQLGILFNEYDGFKKNDEEKVREKKRENRKLFIVAITSAIIGAVIPILSEWLKPKQESQPIIQIQFPITHKKILHLCPYQDTLHHTK